MAADSDLCRCGHYHDLHQHFHDQTYCGTCGPDVCSHFRRDPADRPVLAWLRRRLSRVREG